MELAVAGFPARLLLALVRFCDKFRFFRLPALGLASLSFSAQISLSIFGKGGRSQIRDPEYILQ